VRKKVIEQIMNNVEQCLSEDDAIVKKIEENNQLLTSNLEKISKNKNKKNHDKS
jgi:hypothetical protein